MWYSGSINNWLYNRWRKEGRPGKNQPAKVVQEANEQIREENKVNLLQSEIVILKQKLKESVSKLEETEKKLTLCENERVRLDDLLANKKNDKSKLIVLRN